MERIKTEEANFHISRTRNHKGWKPQAKPRNQELNTLGYELENQKQKQSEKVQTVSPEQGDSDTLMSGEESTSWTSTLNQWIMEAHVTVNDIRAQAQYG